MDFAGAREMADGQVGWWGGRFIRENKSCSIVCALRTGRDLDLLHHQSWMAFMAVRATRHMIVDLIDLQQILNFVRRIQRRCNRRDENVRPRKREEKGTARSLGV